MTREKAKERAYALASRFVNVTAMHLTLLERRWLEIPFGLAAPAPLHDIVGWRARFETGPDAERPESLDVVFDDARGRLLSPR